MLVLTRRPHESVLVGPEIRVTVLESRPEGVRLGIHAPRHVAVLRQELVAEVRERNVQSARLEPADLAMLESVPRAERVPEAVTARLVSAGFQVTPSGAGLLLQDPEGNRLFLAPVR